MADGVQVLHAALPDELDGYDVLLLVPDFAAIEQVSNAFHVRI